MFSRRFKTSHFVFTFPPSWDYTGARSLLPLMYICIMNERHLRIIQEPIPWKQKSNLGPWKLGRALGPARLGAQRPSAEIPRERISILYMKLKSFSESFLAFDFIAVSCTKNQHQIPYNNKYIHSKATFSLHILHLKWTLPPVHVRLQCQPIPTYRALPGNQENHRTAFRGR